MLLTKPLRPIFRFMRQAKLIWSRPMIDEKAVDEIALWSGVIRRCLFDLAQLDSRSPRIKQAALNWLQSPRNDIGSFHWICNSFNVEPSCLRRAMLKRAADLQTTRPGTKQASRAA